MSDLDAIARVEPCPVPLLMRLRFFKLAGNQMYCITELPIRTRVKGVASSSRGLQYVSHASSSHSKLFSQGEWIASAPPTRRLDIVESLLRLLAER